MFLDLHICAVDHAQNLSDRWLPAATGGCSGSPVSGVVSQRGPRGGRQLPQVIAQAAMFQLRVAREVSASWWLPAATGRCSGSSVPGVGGQRGFGLVVTGGFGAHLGIQLLVEWLELRGRLYSPTQDLHCVST